MQNNVLVLSEDKQYIPLKGILQIYLYRLSALLINKR